MSGLIARANYFTDLKLTLTANAAAIRCGSANASSALSLAIGGFIRCNVPVTGSQRDNSNRQ
jgi:hypothetical protein